MLLLVCPTKRVLCLQGHMLLRTRLPQGSFFLFLVTCSLSPYIAMNSVSDYKVRRGRREEKRGASAILRSVLWVFSQENSVTCVTHIIQFDILSVKSEKFREGNGTPLQYSCLENPTDGGAW